MARTKRPNVMSRTIKSLMLSTKYPDDASVIQKINELASLSPKIPPKNILLDFLDRALPIEIENRRKDSGRLAIG